MADTNKTTTASDACPISKKDGNKLVKITDLPLHGNPYPPRDVIQKDEPNSLEQMVRCVRSTVQPYITPIGAFTSRGSDILSTAIAHSKSAYENFGPNYLRNTIITTTAGYLTFRLTRGNGIIKRVLLTSAAVGASTVYFYPKEAMENYSIAWLMAKKKLPSILQQGISQNNNNKPDESTEIKSNEIKTPGS